MASQAHHKKIDGHAPGLKGKDLNAYISAGVYSDHECADLEDALLKLRLGQFIMVREGTAANVCGEALIGGVHFAQTGEDFLGTVIEVIGDELLQLTNQVLYFGGIGTHVLICTNADEYLGELSADVGGSGGCFFFTFLICRGVAPFCLGFGLVLFVIVVEYLEVHGLYPFFLYFICQLNQLINVLFLQLQQLDLLIDGGYGVVIGVIQYGFDILKGELQLTEHEDTVQSGQCGIVIQAVSAFGDFGGGEQSDGIIMVQGSHGDARLFADLFNCEQ